MFKHGFQQSKRRQGNFHFGIFLIIQLNHFIFNYSIESFYF